MSSTKWREVDGVKLAPGIPVIGVVPPGEKGRRLLDKAIDRSTFDDTHPPVAVRKLDLRSLGFEPTRLAIPMAWESPGEISWRSGRLHAHKAGPLYLVHRDAEAPSTIAGLVRHFLQDAVPAAVAEHKSPVKLGWVVSPFDVLR